MDATKTAAPSRGADTSTGKTEEQEGTQVPGARLSSYQAEAAKLLAASRSAAKKKPKTD
jgi:hypothetical protein